MSNPIYGIDASTFQRVIDWGAVKQSGKVQFAFARATDGSTYVDDQFERNHDVAKERGIPIGAYHFFRYGDDPVVQAKAFLEVTKGRLGTLLPMIDVEEQSFASTPILADAIHKISAFVQVIEGISKRKMLLYTNYDTWQRFMQNTDAFAGHPLWLAQTESPDDGLFGGWSDWMLWQDSTIVCPGIEGGVDFDILNPRHTLQEISL